MESLLELFVRIKQLIAKVEIFESSYDTTPEGSVVMVLIEDDSKLIVTDALKNLFEGKQATELLVCDLSHKNRLGLNRAFPYTCPTSFGSKVATFGYGDRLGFANPAQFKAITNTGVMPVLAQQSLRELSLTGRTNSDVIDTAAFAVFREGWKKGYACDGDHLKTLEEVKNALLEGCTMITLDCSQVLYRNSAVSQEAVKALVTEYASDENAVKLGLNFSDVCIKEIVSIYFGAVELIKKVYFEAISQNTIKVDFEVSLDETEEETTPEALYFVSKEASKANVIITNMAPRFIGEFQKAIEYIGDVELFESQLKCHVKIAEFFGYKLSFHSASEKFSVFPAIARQTNNLFHIKTSGTSWLEVVETIAKTDGDLYRQIHEIAVESVDEARKHYHIKE